MVEIDSSIKCMKCGKDPGQNPHLFRDNLTLTSGYLCHDCFLKVNMSTNIYVEDPDNKSTGSHWTWNVSVDNKPIITVDFDHTITRRCLVCRDYKEGEEMVPQEGAKEVLTKLKEKYQIWIFSGRRRPEDQMYIEGFLNKWGIPYDEVLLGKPFACFMIDDRGIHHRGWKETLKEIEMRGG